MFDKNMVIVCIVLSVIFVGCDKTEEESNTGISLFNNNLPTMECEGENQGELTAELDKLFYYGSYEDRHLDDQTANHVQLRVSSTGGDVPLGYIWKVPKWRQGTATVGFESFSLARSWYTPFGEKGFGSCGVTFDGEFVYVGYCDDDSILVYSSEGTKVRTIELDEPAKNCLGDDLAWNGSLIWTLDDSDGDRLCGISLEGVLEETLELQFSPTGRGLAWDGTSFWTPGETGFSSAPNIVRVTSDGKSESPVETPFRIYGMTWSGSEFLILEGGNDGRTSLVSKDGSVLAGPTLPHPEGGTIGFWDNRLWFEERGYVAELVPSHRGSDQIIVALDESSFEEESTRHVEVEVQDCKGNTKKLELDLTEGDFRRSGKPFPDQGGTEVGQCDCWCRCPDCMVEANCSGDGCSNCSTLCTQSCSDMNCGAYQSHSGGCW